MNKRQLPTKLIKSGAAAKMLGVSLNTFYISVRDYLPVYLIGSVRKYDVRDIEEYILNAKTQEYKIGGLKK